MTFTKNQIAALMAIDHSQGCKWHDDGDWNSGTFSNYMKSYGEYPECTCDIGHVALAYMDKPWPLRDLLGVLYDAADHLLQDHDCDHQGYERINAAREAAREILKGLKWGLK